MIACLCVCVPPPTHTESLPLRGLGRAQLGSLRAGQQACSLELEPRVPTSLAALVCSVMRRLMSASAVAHLTGLQGANVSLAITRLESGSRLGTAMPWTGRSREGTVHGKTNKQSKGL